MIRIRSGTKPDGVARVAGSMLPALLLLLPVQAPRASERPFLPELDHGQRTTAEWLERFPGPDAEALWSLYWADARSPEVIEALLETLKAPTPDALDADAVLHEWDVPHECLTLEEVIRKTPWVEEAGSTRPPWSLISPRFDPLEGETPELLAALESGNPIRQVRAAATLVTRGQHVGEALRSLLLGELSGQPLAGAFSWCSRFAGTVGDEGIAALLLDDSFPLDAKEFLFDVKFVPSLRPPSFTGGRELPAALLQLTLETNPLQERARSRLLTLAGLGEWTLDLAADRARHHDSTWTEEVHPDLVPALRGLIGDTLDSIEARGEPLAKVENLLHAAPALAPELRRLVVERLTTWLSRTDGARWIALRVLSYLGESSSELRTAYADWLRASDVRAEGFAFPLLYEHDEETLSAFEQAAPRVRDLSNVLVAAKVAGLLSDAESPVTRHLIEVARSRGDQNWYDLFRAGLAVDVSGTDDEEAPQRLSPLLGIRIRALRARGEPWDEEWERLFELLRRAFDERGPFGPVWQTTNVLATVHYLGDLPDSFVPWALSQLTQDERYLSSYDASALRDSIGARELSREERALLCRPGRRLDDDDPGPFLVQFGKSAIAHASRLRAEAYRMTPLALRDVLSLSKLTGTDQEYLEHAARHSLANERLTVLELVRDFELDTPRIRAIVTSLEDDQDAGVRSLARELVTERGW